MSPEAQVVTPFRPAALPATATRETDSGARAAGYAAGWAAGSRAAAEQTASLQRRLAADHTRAEAVRAAAVDDAVAVLGRAVQAAVARTTPVVADVRRQVYEAAIALAEAVLQHELTDAAGSARAALGRALAAPADLGVHTVRMHPRDVTAARTLVGEGTLVLPAGVELVADPRLAPGDAISEHAAGFLDAQVSTALDRARRALLEDTL